MGRKRKRGSSVDAPSLLLVVHFLISSSNNVRLLSAGRPGAQRLLSQYF